MRARIILHSIIVLLLACMLTGAALFALTRASLRVIHSWEQPNTVSYDQFDPYVVSIIELDRSWRGLPFSAPRRYGLYLGLDRGEPEYGHLVELSFFSLYYTSAQETEEALRRSQVTWLPEGVRFEAVTGHQIFIPSQAFVGPR